MRAKYSFAFVAITAAVGINLALSSASNSADRTTARGSELLLAQGGPALAPAGNQIPPPLPTASADDDDVQQQAGSEIQTRGPVHEAFARPVEMNPGPGPTIAKRPPDPIDEVPPDAAPEGENVEWISGYWAWDDDRNDFIWISGVFRNSPPNQTWVAGYWSEVPGGYQWTSGFWATNGNTEVQYLAEAPPQTQENGPSSPQPSENHFWIPGNWVYRNTNYAWQAGYWSPCQDNWVWVPAQYAWTPAGYVFVPGYWDHTVQQRGCLFAPVYFNQPVYAQPAYVYTPRVLINVGLFNDCLFVRPRYCHYYVGDYFEPRYATYGFRPWFSAGVRLGGGVGIGVGYGYDPLFVYANWHNGRRDRNWLANTQRHYDDLRDNPGRRPPHTYAAQQQLLRKAGNDQRRDYAIASTIKQAEKDPSRAGVRMHNVSTKDHQDFVDQSKQFKKVTQERANLEKTNTIPGLADGSAGNRRDRGPRGDDGNDGDKKGVPGRIGNGTLAGGDKDSPVNAKTLKIPTVATNRRNIGSDGNVGKATTDGAAVTRNLDPNKADQNRSNAGFGGKGNPVLNEKLTDDKDPTDRNPNRKSGGNAGNGNKPTIGQLPDNDQNDRKGRGPLGQADTKDSSKKGGSVISQNPGNINPDVTNRTRVNANSQGGDVKKQNDDNPAGKSVRNLNPQGGGGNAQNDNNAAGKSVRNLNPPSGTNPDPRRLNTQGTSNPGGQSNSGGQPNFNPPTLQRKLPTDAGGGGGGGATKPRGGGDSSPNGGNNNPINTRSLNLPNNSGGGGGGNGGGGGGGNSQRPVIRQNDGGNSGGGGGYPTVKQSNPPPKKPDAGGGSKGPPQKQDDDDSKRKKRSEAVSPKTDMHLMPSERALVDVQDGLKHEQLAIKRSTRTGANEFALENKSLLGIKDELDLDSPINDRQKQKRSETTNSSPSSSSPTPWRVPNLQTPGRATSPAGQNVANDGTASGLAGSNSQRQSSNNRGSGLTLKSAKANAEDAADSEYVSQPGSDVRSDKLSDSNSKYDYQTMAQRGKSISQSSGLAVGGGENANGIDRSLKDPVTKFGLGNPSTRTMYGPGGAMGGGSSGLSSSASDAASGRGGSGSYMSSNSLPQVPRWQGNGRTSGEVQNYVPSTTNSSNSYDPRQR